MEEKIMKEKYEGSDRRRSPRVRATIVEYSPVDNEEISELSFTENISAGGICIFTPHNLAVGSDLALKIFIPYNHDPLIVKGKIVWKRDSRFLDQTPERNLDIGIQFTEIDQTDCKSIAAYIRKYSKKKETKEQRQKITF